MSLREALKPKADQLNADDLIGGLEIVITVTKVDINVGSEQPIVIHYENENKRPYKPCKSMGRILMHFWGENEDKYVGKQIKLYRDDAVKFGSEIVGGIRIKALSHINERETVVLSTSRGKRGRFTVEPLQVTQLSPAPAQSQPSPKTLDAVEKAIDVIHGFATSDDIMAFLSDDAKQAWIAKLPNELKQKINSTLAAKRNQIIAAEAPPANDGDIEVDDQTEDMFATA